MSLTQSSISKTYPPKGSTLVALGSVAQSFYNFIDEYDYDVSNSLATTDWPTNSLSNSDGTPCNCNTATMWLDLILIADRSKSIGVGGLGSVSFWQCSTYCILSGILKKSTITKIAYDMPFRSVLNSQPIYTALI